MDEYHEIEIFVSLASLRNYIEPLLYTSGIIMDDEELLSVAFKDDHPDIFPIILKLKKRQPITIEVIK